MGWWVPDVMGFRCYSSVPTSAPPCHKFGSFGCPLGSWQSRYLTSPLIPVVRAVSDRLDPGLRVVKRLWSTLVGLFVAPYFPDFRNCPRCSWSLCQDGDQELTQPLRCQPWPRELRVREVLGSIPRTALCPVHGSLATGSCPPARPTTERPSACSAPSPHMDTLAEWPRRLREAEKEEERGRRKKKEGEEGRRKKEEERRKKKEGKRRKKKEGRRKKKEERSKQKEERRKKKEEDEEEGRRKKEEDKKKMRKKEEDKNKEERRRGRRKKNKMRKKKKCICIYIYMYEYIYTYKWRGNNCFGACILFYFCCCHLISGCCLKQDCRWRPYRVEYTRSLPNSEVKQPRAWLVLWWGTAREDQGWPTELRRPCLVLPGSSHVVQLHLPRQQRHHTSLPCLWPGFDSQRAHYYYSHVLKLARTNKHNTEKLKTWTMEREISTRQRD